MYRLAAVLPFTSRAGFPDDFVRRFGDDARRERLAEDFEDRFRVAERRRDRPEEALVLQTFCAAGVC